MADIRDLMYHGVRQQVRRVLTAMGPERIDKGLTAFETGASSWSNCFFARAYPELNLHWRPEHQIAEALGMPGNYVPMRITYTLFDGAGVMMSKQQLQGFIKDFLDIETEKDAEKMRAINALIESTSVNLDMQEPVWVGADPESWKD